MGDLFEEVDRLLHDAEHADGGARMARAMGDWPNADLLAAKAKTLRAGAETLDPAHTAPAWESDADDAIAAREAADAFAAFLRRHHP